jgi:hypothetical protein
MKKSTEKDIRKADWNGEGRLIKHLENSAQEKSQLFGLRMLTRVSRVIDEASNCLMRCACKWRPGYNHA